MPKQVKIRDINNVDIKVDTFAVRALLDMASLTGNAVEAAKIADKALETAGRARTLSLKGGVILALLAERDYLYRVLERAPHDVDALITAVNEAQRAE